MTFAKFVGAVVLLLAVNPAFAADAPLRVLVPAYAQAAVTALTPVIEAQAGVAIALEFATTDVIVERLTKGDAGDLVVTSKNSLAPEAMRARVDGQHDVAVSTVGIAVARDAKPPKLASSQDLARFLTETPSFGYSTAQSGRHIAGVIEKLGLTEAMKAKSQTGAGLMGTRIIEGKLASVGQQISELRLAGLTNIVPLPDEHQLRIVVTAAAVKTGRRAQDAAKVIDVLASAGAAQAYKDAGLIPLKK
ncbi:MAG: molybdate ABC transporter substrate-binding protein [Rhodospirillaceae bacterium]